MVSLGCTAVIRVTNHSQSIFKLLSATDETAPYNVKNKTILYVFGTFFFSSVSSTILASVMVGRVGTVGTPGILGIVGTLAKASKFSDECTPGSIFKGACNLISIYE